MSVLAALSCALPRWFRKIGIAMAARMPMMMMTTSSSINVNPLSGCSRRLMQLW